MPIGFRALIATLPFLFPAITLAADDVKAYHGSTCRLRQSGNGLPATQGGLYASSGGVNCGSGGTFEAQYCPVVCPLIRDKIDDDLSLEHIAVEFFNGPSAPAGTISCTAFTQQEDTSGSTLDSLQLSTTTQGANAFTWTDLESTAGNEGSYAVECDLGVYDSLYHIYVRETTDTGATD